MDENYNIYEKIRELEFAIAEQWETLAWFKKYEYLIKEHFENEKNNIEDKSKVFWTVNDILRTYEISEQTFYRWKKLVPIKSAGKQGKKIRYNKKNVIKFFKEIQKLKNTMHELFRFKIKRAS